MLKVWGRGSSFNVQKVLWLVGELGLSHRHIPAGGDHGGLDEPSFLAMNPHGRVPVIDDGGVMVWESHAILRYLAARYGGSEWWPASPVDRAQADGWMDWAQTALQRDFLTGVFWGWYRTPEPERDNDAIRTALAACAKHFLLLDQILANRPFLGGDQPGLADIPCGTHLFRYYALEIDRPRTPNVEAWYARLQARPAYRKAVMIPFDEMKGRLAY
ncbi:glutathione S-transferase family protein [Caulobacter vibrioides]|uniref:Glutathione S-transferase family protein n=2 Tax=Caulobacter vibrioides TaxID=155892 RepID=Q9A522_CAUVC|nr:glutathione S-transferase [Caulobacter vibrioides]YP_002518103.1 glutathione S-transferase [Caulobacter vibrioides NA1000]AAK24614.1 glutathione S-transferase family protein [Caulobacter vibrioides CB15]ACL96195.1 glutathione S-transferase [Caulobacter vibrioides NA1000]ATC29489.1 glutathione S-transferase [Caulobacter vibrioides]QXZ51009.1 glutathione S-transferase [Caulobacter vibrioides]